ncbi:SulP family inorganic anion transporter [Hyphococcus sp. DH-69]|uniref:SulP family inorganic anion transporter n=1 Tax=Hyphococcus formosus TaxID=3143534 RepID=UPI00398ABB36
MTAITQNSAPQPGTSFKDLFTPKIVTVLREGYDASALRADLIAGLTVAIVALPLSMAIAIASGASPAQGLYTAAIGGFIVSLLGGSRFQIGGPAGAFIVLVASIVHQHGMDGLFLATIMAGFMLMAIGFFRLGTYIKFIPFPVTVGFTVGIAALILTSQLKDLLGLTVIGPEPLEFAEKIPALWEVRDTANMAAIGLSVGTIAVIAALQRFKPSLPGMLIAVTGGAIAAGWFGLPVETIGSKFGGIPSSLPVPALPVITTAKVIEMLPSAFALALLGAIESLLSAVVADGMTGRRHRSNCELVAQGAANIVSPLFGGICVTGTIARTATNIRAGARSPFAGVLHAIFILVFIVVAAPLASFIPLASLAGVLVMVAWNMIEKEAFVSLLKASRGDLVVLLTTLGLTIFRDLTEAIVIGFALGSVMFIHRMSNATTVAAHIPLVPDDQADDDERTQQPFEADLAHDPAIAVYRIRGAFFFGAAASLGAAFDNLADQKRALILDFAQVPLVDSTGAQTIEGFARKVAKSGVTLYISGASREVERDLKANGILPPLVCYEESVAAAVLSARETINASKTAS